MRKDVRALNLSRAGTDAAWLVYKVTTKVWISSLPIFSRDTAETRRDPGIVSLWHHLRMLRARW